MNSDRNTMKLKFIHTADLHLGAPLLGIPWHDKLSNAVYAAFQKVIDEALARQVDFVIISGDVFDQHNISYNDFKFFCEEIARLNDTPVYVCAGNHDPFEAWQKVKTFGELPRNLKLFGKNPTNYIFEKKEKHKDKHEENESDNNTNNNTNNTNNSNTINKCYICGKSFVDLEDPIKQDFSILKNNQVDAHKYPINIGVLHTEFEPTETFNTQGFNYWALGHIHKRATYKYQNSQVPCTIAYPGCIQGLHINSTSTNGVNYVELTENSCEVEFIPAAQVEWQKLSADVSGCETIDALINKCKAQVDPAKYICMRMTLTGKTDLHKTLVTNLENIRAQLCTDNCYCQEVIDQTTINYDEEKLVLFPRALLDVDVEEPRDYLRQKSANTKFSKPLNCVEDLDVDKLIKKAKSQLLDELEVEGVTEE